MSLCYLNDLLKDLGVELGAILGLDKQVGARDLLGGVQLVRLSTVDEFNACLLIYISTSSKQRNIAYYSVFCCTLSFYVLCSRSVI